MPASLSTGPDGAVLTLDWPQRRNAIGPAQARELREALAQATDANGTTLTITGNGAFCAGGDLEYLRTVAGASAEAIRQDVYGLFQPVIRAVRSFPKVTIAAIDGAAVGFGMDLALACDMRLIGADGWLLQGWAQLGLIAGTGGVAMLRRLNPGALWSLITSRQPLNGSVCASLGLGEDCAGRRAIEVAAERAAQLSRLPPATISAYLRLQREADRDFDEHLAECAELQSQLISAPSFAALLEQRTTRDHR
jgi:enoyl-CoA hydratase/carnithine racemase